MALEKTENQIRARVRMPGDFQEGSFKTNIIDANQGISQIAGRLEGKTTATVQSWRFNIEKGWTVSKAREWLNEHNIEILAKDDIEEFAALFETKQASIEFEELKDVEIFASGTWHGYKFDNSDLDSIIDSFKKTKNEIKPYLKLGHDDKQKLVHNSGLPSLGWIKSLKRVGNKIVADFKDVPKIIADLINKRAYKRISSEIYMNYQDSKNSIFPKVLRAVALLGGTTPEVTTLKDVVALYVEDTNKDFEVFEFSHEDLNKTKEVNDMDKEKFDEQVKDFEKKQKALEAKEKEIKEFEAKQEVLAAKEKEILELEEKYKKVSKLFSDGGEGIQKSLLEFQIEKEATLEAKKKYEEILENSLKDGIKIFTDNLVSENKLVPAQLDMAKKLLEHTANTEKIFEFTKAELYGLKEKMTLNETLRTFMGSFPDMGLLKEFTSTEGGTIDSDTEAEQLVTKYMEEHKVDYGKAQLEISKVRPELFDTADGQNK